MQSQEKDNPYVPIDLSLFDQLWVPDIYIYDLKSIRSYKIFSDFAGLWVVNGSQILYSHEAHISFYCPMRFEHYPLDEQASFKTHTLLQNLELCPKIQFSEKNTKIVILRH